MRLQFLSGIGLVEAIVLATILGALFGYALTTQIKMQRLASERVSKEKVSLIVRLAAATGSFGVLFLAAVSSKSVESMRYEYFMLISACAAVLVMLYMRSKAQRVQDRGNKKSEEPGSS